MLLLLALCSLAANLGGRYPDPLVTAIARDFSVSTQTVALLSSAFTLPFGLSQPFLGPLGDAVGKPAVFKVCFWLLALGLFASAVAESLSLLFAARILAGLAAGGVIPLGLAMLADATAPGERQVAFARFSSGAVVGQLIGLTAAGALGEVIGWRNALLVPAVTALAAALAATIRLPAAPPASRRPFRLSGTIASYRTVFRNPDAKVCYAVAFAEGVAVYGSLPFIVELLEGQRIGGPREAGIVGAGLGLGCVIVSIFVRPVVRSLGADNMMRWGGAIAGLALAGLAWSRFWWLHGFLFVWIGVGFFMIHNALQSRVMELAPEARGSATALHYFAFFMGQAAGPLIFGVCLGSIGSTASFLVNAALIGATGVVAVTLFRRPRSG